MRLVRSCGAQRRFFTTQPPPFSEVFAKHAQGKAPSLDQILVKWKEYPGVVAQLQQLNNTFGELQKDTTWLDIEKQFKHDPNARTIDWEFLEENLRFPEIIRAYKNALETLKFEEINVDPFIREMEKVTEQFSAEIREQNAKYAEMLPALEKDIARTKYFRDNLATITIDEERLHEPQIFAQIEKELEEYNWDEEEVSMEKDHGKHH